MHSYAPLSADESIMQMLKFDVANGRGEVTSSGMATGIVPFDPSLADRWRQAVETTAHSPSPLGGPEFNTTSIRGWQRTHLFTSGELLIPFFKSECTHLRFLHSDVYTGVAINSLLGVSEISETTWDSLRQLPHRCVYYLDVPEEWYRNSKPQWRAIGFREQERSAYHKIVLPATYDEWFLLPRVRRQNIRRGQDAGLSVVFGGRELLDRFYELYLQSHARWQSRQSASQAHSFDRFRRLCDAANSAVHLAAATLNDRIIAAVIFCAYQRTAGYLYGGHDIEYQNLRPNNFLHAEIIKRLISTGVKEYNLGMSLGQKELERFKESLGAERHVFVTLCRERFVGIKRLLGGYFDRV